MDSIFLEPKLACIPKLFSKCFSHCSGIYPCLGLILDIYVLKYKVTTQIVIYCLKRYFSAFVEPVQVEHLHTVHV